MDSHFTFTNNFDHADLGQGQDFDFDAFAAEQNVPVDPQLDNPGVDGNFDLNGFVPNDFSYFGRNSLSAIPGRSSYPPLQQDQAQPPYYGTYNPTYFEQHSYDPQAPYTYPVVQQAYLQSPGFINPVQVNNDYYEPAQSSPVTFRKRARSLSSTELEQPTKKHRVGSRHGTESPIRKYSSEYSGNDSRSSSGTDRSTRRMLRQTRRDVHRASAIQVYQAERPQAREDRPWVRTNATTRGLTTRTGKINNYKATYEQRPHPVGDWTAPSGFVFRYTPNGEFADKYFEAKQIEEFILHYPKSNGQAKLKLFIQKCPTDSARRYFSQSHSKCRFKECPAHLYQTGTILHGHYRIAFDEKWNRDRTNADPFGAAGFIHLYCMERFLDFPKICRQAHVEVDVRSLVNEPKGKFAGTLYGQPECEIAKNFVQACRGENGVTLNEIPEFRNYPKHRHYKNGAPKPHMDTLTYHMTYIKAEHRPQAQIRQFKARGLKNSHIIQNMGDLEVLFQDNQKKKKAVRKARGKKRKADDDDDDAGDEGNNAVTRSSAELINKKLSEGSRKKRRYSPPQTRNDLFCDEDEEDEELPQWQGHDDDSDDDGLAHTPTQGARQSARNKNRPKPNYSQEQDLDFESLLPRIPRRQRHSGGKAAALQPASPAALQLYDGYEPVQQAANQAADPWALPELPAFEDDPEYDDIKQSLLNEQIWWRRQSSFSRPSSRMSSVLKSALASRRASGRRVSYGENMTQLFDKDEPPQNTLPARYNLRHQPSSPKAKDVIFCGHDGKTQKPKSRQGSRSHKH